MVGRDSARFIGSEHLQNPDMNRSHKPNRSRGRPRPRSQIGRPRTKGRFMGREQLSSLSEPPMFPLPSPRRHEVTNLFPNYTPNSVGLWQFGATMKKSWLALGCLGVIVVGVLVI